MGKFPTQIRSRSTFIFILTFGAIFDKTFFAWAFKRPVIVDAYGVSPAGICFFVAFVDVVARFTIPSVSFVAGTNIGTFVIVAGCE